MKYRTIETSREIRLWISQIILPATGIAGAIIMSNPELKEKAVSKWNGLKENFKK